MMTEALLALLTLVFIYLALRRPRGLPPGLWGLPVVGKLPNGSVYLGDQVEELRRTYGDIILWRMGCRINVFLCNYDVIKKAMARPELSDRPDFFTYTIFGSGAPLGIIFSNSTLWQKNRRLALRHLRDLGMGKTWMETVMQEEAQHLVNDFRKHTDKGQVLPLSVGVAVFNIIMKMVADIRFDMNDPKGRDIVQQVLTTNDNLQGSVFLFNLFPFLLKFSPPFLKKKFGYYALCECADKLRKCVGEFIKDHRAALDPSQPKDLIDQFLIEQQKRGGNNDGHDEELNLNVMVADLLLAGIETTTTIIRWTILYLAKYPEVQKRLQKEIDATVPKGTLPFYHERNRQPYMEAVMNEVHRVVSMVPMAAGHSASQDTQLEGYNLPKGTVVVPFLECCHKDPQLWKYPHRFYPEHFLNQDGSFNNCKEGFLPFGVGRRSCVGESLAKVEFFILLSALVQSFTFTPAPGEDLSTKKDPKVIVINCPKKYQVVITERE